MKSKENLKNFTNYFVLLLSIIFLIVILHLINNNSSMYIDLFGNRMKTDDKILLKKNNEFYLSYEYIKENIDNEIYFDNVSKKIVISSNKGLFKIKINDKNININFEYKTINNEGVIEKDYKYISLEVLKEAYDFDITICNNTIYLYNNIYSEGKLKYNNVAVYIDSNLKNRIVDYVDKKDDIEAICKKDEFVLVKINNKEVGYVLENSLKFDINEEIEEEQEDEYKVFMFADSNNKVIQKDLPVDAIMLDMFEITQITTSINEKNINESFLDSVKKNGYKLYGIVGNGYDLAGFSTTTMSQILLDETKRINLINNLTNKIEEYNLDGIVLDFRKLKEKDIEYYIQFVKELKAFSKKEIIVNIDCSEYKTYIPVINYTDFSVINIYGQRDLTSTVAGSIAEIDWMKDIIEKLVTNSNTKKIVVGIPAYTILWTEKNSNVVGSEIYNLKAIQNFIKQNNLDIKEINGQNYVELEKGSLRYRMWLEDELSINTRLNIIKEKGVAGIAIYKFGYENYTLINVLKNNY